MMNKIVIALFCLAVSALAVADSGLSSEQATRTLADDIAQRFLNEEFEAGLDRAKPHWPLPEVEIDSLANTIKQQWSVVSQRFGTPVGIEYVRTERIGESFVRHIYLHKFQNHAIHWQFTFYRPGEAWKVNSINFSDSLSHLFEP